MDRLLAKFRAPKTGNPHLVRIQRRDKIIALIAARLRLIVAFLFIAGYAWMLILPIIPTETTDKIDENALLPAQINTQWNWDEVHAADRYLDQLEHLRDTNASSAERALYLQTEFLKLGLDASTQSYTLSTAVGDSAGVNAYALLPAPRTPGAEAIIISASWQSRTGEGDGTLNLRGVATVLSMASFVRRYSHWAKDLVFVVSDGYLDGMQAWLSAYHGVSQSNLVADNLDIATSVVWIALNVDYPGHSFSHLGIFHEGLNGRLPNQDLLRSFRRISRQTGGSSVILYDYIDNRDNHKSLGMLGTVLPNWLQTPILSIPQVRKYIYHASNVLQHANYQARGIGSGTHALFHKYRIDAFTMYALPATGPHGFHTLGKVLESTLRTANNMLERLHASLFFYLLTSSDFSLKIGMFLPSVICVSVAMMFHGLGIWTSAGWTQIAALEKSKVAVARRTRPTLPVLAIMAMTHAVGAVLFYLVNTSAVATSAFRQVLIGLVIATLPMVLSAPPKVASAKQDEDTQASVAVTLKALNICLASTVISILSVLNFSLAASLAVLLGVPLCLPIPSGSGAKWVAYVAYSVLGLGWLAIPGEVGKMVWGWQMLGVWTCPIVCMIYTPLVLQAVIVCKLT